MEDNSKFFVVARSVLPDIFGKVIKAKKLIVKEGVSVSEAVAAVGISRSAFYKYRDNVFVLGENRIGSTVIIALDLDHKPGLLSNVLNSIADFGANILTINQTIPINGAANVTLSIEMGNAAGDIDRLLGKIKQNEGVMALKIIAQE